MLKWYWMSTQKQCVCRASRGGIVDVERHVGKCSKKCKKKNDFDLTRGRTWNLLMSDQSYSMNRSQAPCHWAIRPVVILLMDDENFIMNILKHFVVKVSKCPALCGLHAKNDVCKRPTSSAFGTNTTLRQQHSHSVSIALTTQHKRLGYPPDRATSYVT
jgi:hypothetical protein